MDKLNHRERYRFVWPCILIVLVFGVIICVKVFAEVPRIASEITITGNRLMVALRQEDGVLADARPYIIKGLSWAAATKAPHEGLNPYAPEEDVAYGFFFNWPGRVPQGHELFAYWFARQYKEYYATDIPLMKDMNVNTVRVYSHFGLEGEADLRILDELYYNGIMVIITVATSKEDLENSRYLEIVNMYKSHPAILMWSLGNEWNLERNKYYGYKTVSEAALAIQNAALKIKEIDILHPVSSCLGDRFTDKVKENTIAAILKKCPAVDIWGLNIYRNRSFRDLFQQWKELSDKPMYISEFGTDSFNTKKYTCVNEFQAVECSGVYDEDLQADFVIVLWDDITKNLSAVDADKICLGGLVHEFNDSLWKVGSYHVNLGGTVEYEDPDQGYSYEEYNTQGFVLIGGHPDDVANEEYFGIVDAQRRPKKIFYELKEYYEKLKSLEE
ncbi:MAG: glycoside hydrolase family 2 TIM barrel-domain containing protein [Candidatus Omnitrophota bacterium]